MGIQTDITQRKQAEPDLKSEREKLERRVEHRTKELKDNEEYLASIIQTIRESLMVLDKDLTIISANPYFYRTFKITVAETVGNKLYELGEGHWNIQALRNLLEHVLPNNNPFEGYEVEIDFPHIGHRHMLLNAYQVEHEGPTRSAYCLQWKI